jgi:hypothetical protein
VKLRFPEGYKATMQNGAGRGSVLLESNVTATWYTTYSFGDDFKTNNTAQTTLKGGGVWATGQPYTTYEVMLASNQLSPFCNSSVATFQMNNRVLLSSTGPGAIAKGSHVDILTHDIEFLWEEC